ncbi:hypothetical protein [Streptomyces sp. SID3343]|uniref:hypothetical protein n=1 Tax=Streptomyces sp. SID3343 TaxID=2690260 RepID=UPI00136D62E3|nr:hypothetical protein [Streptomyces sp. SID3343]MYW03626.1 hypothetical protein [Streptomyces sp. SID3343]
MRTHPAPHRTRFSRAVVSTTAVALGSVLMLSACSSGDSDKKKDEVASLGDKKGATGSGAPKEAAAGAKGDMVKYAGCMREHGIDMPDPQADGSMMAQALPAADAGAEMEKMQKASEDCTKWLPNGGVVSEKEKAEQREKGLKFARCMREHGIDMPDPDPEGLNALGLDAGADQTKMNEAMKACSEGGAGGAMTVTR